MLFSDGWYGRSAIGIFEIDYNSQQIKTKISKALEPWYFGEGTTVFNLKSSDSGQKEQRVYQMTYVENTVFQYDLGKDLVSTRNLSMPDGIGEGWGMTHDDSYIYVSNGSNVIFMIHPENFTIFKQLSIEIENPQTAYFNELEYVNGSLYSNSFTTHNIYKIDLKSQKVVY